ERLTGIVRHGDDAALFALGLLQLDAERLTAVENASGLELCQLATTLGQLQLQITQSNVGKSDDCRNFGLEIDTGCRLAALLPAPGEFTDGEQRTEDLAPVIGRALGLDPPDIIIA